MKQKLVKIFFYSNLTIAGIALGLNVAFPISPGITLTGFGALFAAIVGGIEINKENNKKASS